MLSDIQQQILCLALKKRFITTGEILSALWGWQLGAWGSRKTCIGEREYARGHASLSRSITSLWAAGNLIIWKNLTGAGTGITLTDEGKKLARTIMEKMEDGKD
jgi:hypothetical protein